MASIWKHPESKYWVGCWTDETGKQRKRSTKQTDRSKAEEIARGWEYAAGKASLGTLTEVQTRKILSEILERTTGNSIRAISARSYFNDWLAENDALKSGGTAARYRNLTNKFLEHLGPRAEIPLDAITTQDIQGFVNARIKTGLAAKTIRVDTKCIAAAFNRAFNRGLLLMNPAKGIELPKRTSSSKRETFTPTQVKMLTDAAPDQDWKTVILLGYYTAARLKDCAEMTPENVNFTAGTIEYYPQKTEGQSEEDGKVIIPLHPELEKHLMNLCGTDKPMEFLCPDLANKDVGGAHGLSQRFIDIMKTAGIDPKKGAGKGKRKFSKLSFHSLRHSFNSALANAGVAQETRMKLTGHKSTSVNTGYTHHELETLRKAVNKLPSITKAKR